MFEKKNTPVVNDLFFAPLLTALEAAASKRKCTKHDDLDFLVTGIRRILSNSRSGRDFLQQVFTSSDKSWSVTHFFGTLKSKRRLKVAQEVLTLLCQQIKEHPVIDFPDIPELEDFDLYAGDGHFLAAACHDPMPNDKKNPAGHFFALDLRSGGLNHLSAAQPRPGKVKEHDMKALKRLSPTELLQGAEKGHKVLYAWDRAGIDFIQWHKWKSKGIYFISRKKKNMKLFPIGENRVDRSDPRNAGVISDLHMGTSQHVGVRQVHYYDAASQTEYYFLTNEMNLPPGLIAWIFLRRWDIEKVFDETKNRLMETKSWASSLNAKTLHGHFIAMAYNLLALLHRHLEEGDQLPTDRLEEKRKADRRAICLEEIRLREGSPGYVLQQPPKRTQMGCKFIRWVRHSIERRLRYDEAVAALAMIYANF